MPSLWTTHIAPIAGASWPGGWHQFIADLPREAVAFLDEPK